MSRNSSLRWVLLVATNVAFWCMLSLQQTNGANSGPTAPTTSVAQLQRAEMIAQLKEIKTGINILVAYRKNGALPETDPLQP